MALIRPFLPAKDFAVSKTFYEALGFEIGYQDDDLAIFDYEGAGFLLQNFYSKEWAENLQLQLFVKDLDTWWTRTAALAEKFGTRVKEPAEQPWGLRVGFLIDPAGVCWQVSQP